MQFNITAWSGIMKKNITFVLNKWHVALGMVEER